MPIFAADGDLAPSDPARGRAAGNLLIVHARAVRLNRESALLEHRQFDDTADQCLAWFSRQGTEGVIGISDAAKTIPAHDDVALCLQQTARAFFRLAQFPIAVG